MMMGRSNTITPANSLQANESLRTQADNVGREAWNNWRTSLDPQVSVDQELETMYPHRTKILRSHI